MKSGDFICLILFEAKDEVKEIISVVTDVLEMSEKGYMIETGEAILPLQIDLKIIIIQKGHT